MATTIITSVMAQYIYLLQEREFVKTKERIYKLGKTKQKNGKRFSQYPKDSVLLLQMVCFNCDENEKKLLSIFKTKYKQRLDIGTEYFEGDYKMMMMDIYAGNLNELMSEQLISTPQMNETLPPPMSLIDEYSNDDYSYEEIPDDIYTVDKYSEFVKLTGFNAKIKITNKKKHSGYICIGKELWWRKIDDDLEESLKGYLESHIESNDVEYKYIMIESTGEILSMDEYRKKYSNNDIHYKTITVSYNRDAIIKDICLKCYDKNAKHYIFKYNEHFVYTCTEGTTGTVPKIFNGTFTSIETINSIILEKPASIFYIKENINIYIVSTLLNLYLKSQSIVKHFHQLCHNIFMTESKTETIFFDFYNKYEHHYDDEYCLVSELLLDLAYYVFKNHDIVITSDAYYENKQKYKKIKPRAIIIDESKQYTTQTMLNECIKLGIKNIIVRTNDIKNNIYNIRTYKWFISVNMDSILSHSMNRIEYDEYQNTVKKNNPLICQSLLRTNFLKWCCTLVY